MTTVNGITAAKAAEIEANSVVDADIVGGHLILTRHNGTEIDAGNLSGVVAAPPVVTALPAVTAADHGREVYLLVDEAGTYGGPYFWHCSYRHYKSDGVTPNPLTYKWAVLSVSGHHRIHDTASTLNVAAVAAPSAGTQDGNVPALIVPFSGDYEGVASGHFDSTAGGIQLIWRLASSNNVASVVMEMNVRDSTDWDESAASVRMNGLLASNTYNSYANVIGASGVGRIGSRSLAIKPIRIG